MAADSSPAAIRAAIREPASATIREMTSAPPRIQALVHPADSNPAASAMPAAMNERAGTGPIENAYDAPPAGEPIILPGESLSKYRRGEEHAASASATPTPANAIPLTLAPPASLYTVAAGWDGGDVLPGETLRRRPGPESAPRSPSPGASRGSDRGHLTGATTAARGATASLAATHAIPAMTTVRQERRPAQRSPSAAEIPHARRLRPESQSEFAAPIVAEPATPAPEADYEPSEASASYRVDPIAPSEFRQSAPVLEAPPEVHAEPLAQRHTFTEISAAGEMHSEPAETPSRSSRASRPH